jgi:hypothetical protein
VRGLKGAVGTQLDLLTLFGGDARKVAELERRMLKHLGFASAWNAVGQVYPRSLDFEVVAALFQLASGPPISRARCGSWPAMSWPARASRRARSAPPPCRTR